MLKMYVIQNIAPSTFFCEETNLEILDENKNRFYHHANNEKSITFNLPVGKYFSKNRVFREKNFIPYNIEFKKPTEIKKFKVVECKNKNKATIFPSLNLIFIDKSILNHKYKPLKYFVLGHEFSHLLPDGRHIQCVSSEGNFCDENSGAWLLNIGFNPSQVKISQRITGIEGIRGNCLNEKMNGYRR